ncbi:aarF domain-containing kinase [Fistulifera solaris]|uniref:AarF domain-containing kinase n=1 Tax=Fistulifera solaris TaxID=1519565 RepID=A0A1Z5KP15_FISSO|nr:aarF domain-containing kinase [Fistulifera solaris]|eukprot:GAX28070.1 aarF domain-containing kinase [Fistulifera solaris]
MISLQRLLFIVGGLFCIEVSALSSTTINPTSRLQKARLLLEEYTSSEALLLNNTAAAEDTSPNAVASSAWRNGHLVGNDKVVTRWSQGVQVAEPVKRYDPILAQQQLFRQPTKWLVRNVQIAWPLGWWAVGVITDYVFQEKNNRRKRAEQLRQAISSLGPAIIKAGQALSSRPDLLPAEYLEELQKLQDDVPRFPNEVAFRVACEELGIDDFESVFLLEQEEPVAAASIGQVYKARLQANGDVVALKIQRPNCEQVIALDLYILRWWSGVYNRIFQILQRDIDLQAVMDDFGELIYREIDYIAEMSNAQRFQELYAGVRDVFVPRVYSELTTSKVLTMEWVDGFRLTDQDSLQKYGLDKSALVDTLVQCTLKQILENGLFHADPHAGNLLATPDGRLCYLDFGMMSYAAQNQRNGFLLAVVHIVNRDWAALVQLYVQLGFIPEGTDLEPIQVALERALPDVLNADITELNFKNVINKLGDIMYTYPFSLPPFYIAIIRCLGVLEGLAIQVDPKSRIISKAYPYIASRVLTDPQDPLQEAFKRLAFTPEGSIRTERLESLLDQAKDASGYDVTAALNLLVDKYLLAPDSDRLLEQMSDQIVQAVDTLGMETVQYLAKAGQALAINDEVAAVRAFRSIQQLLDARVRADSEDEGDSPKWETSLELPEMPPTMRRSQKILDLLLSQSAEGSDPAKFVPLVRKLIQDERIRRSAQDVVARVGERVLSRSLRSTFGLPPPLFGKASSLSTVTEDREK